MEGLVWGTFGPSETPNLRILSMDSLESSTGYEWEYGTVLGLRMRHKLSFRLWDEDVYAPDRYGDALNLMDSAGGDMRPSMLAIKAAAGTPIFAHYSHSGITTIPVYPWIQTLAVI